MAEEHGKCWRNCKPVLVHGEFCEMNDPVSSVNNLQGAGMKGNNSQKSQTQLDLDLNKRLWESILEMSGGFLKGLTCQSLR